MSAADSSIPAIPSPHVPAQTPDRQSTVAAGSSGAGAGSGAAGSVGSPAVGGGFPIASGMAAGESASPLSAAPRGHPGISGPVSSEKAPAGARDAFAADELAIVLSYYDLGTIEAIREFPRGSRKAPKLLIRTDSGTYLLKRRAHGKDDPFKVAFCHALQLFLAGRQFPLPHLIGTRKDNNSMLQWRGGIYEIFEYIKGTSYDNSLEATAEAGRILALFHKLLTDYQPEYEPPQGSYHGARVVTASMESIPLTISRTEPRSPDRVQQLEQVVQFLHAAYNAAAMRANEIGLADWPMQIVHSDWHPGNMLFRGPRVVAVIDYDSARIQQRIIDVANGALQFSIIGGGDNPAQWPDYIDESRFKRFLRGYDSVPDCLLSKAELRAVPWLMIEALIAESVIPIAATGSFARIEGMGFLTMVERKVRWLQDHAEHLANVV